MSMLPIGGYRGTCAEFWKYLASRIKSGPTPRPQYESQCQGRQMAVKPFYSGIALIWINAWNAEGIAPENLPNHLL